MKFIVSSELLLKELQVIGGIINSSNTLPILDNFLFEINNETLTLSASDLETTMSTSISIESKDSEVPLSEMFGYVTSLRTLSSCHIR